MDDRWERQPDLLLSPCRTQRVAGFKYLYLEDKHVAESEVDTVMVPLMERIFAAHRQTFGAAEPPPLLATFTDRKDASYALRVGFAVGAKTPPLEGALVMVVPPALCAGVLVWGADVTAGYAPLMDYADRKGLEPTEGWRERYLYWEHDGSPNNVTLVQYVVAA
jgi:hypothetical protein